MKFLGRGSGPSDSSATAVEAPEDAPAEVVGAGRTAPKGRPTPSRRTAQSGGRNRGPVAPPPRTQREAFRRAKQQRGSKEDRRKASSDRRKRMMAGDDSVLPIRERGPVKAFVRDLVDSRRNLMGLFMPMAILIFITILVPSTGVQSIGTAVCLIMLAAMVVEGLLLGRFVNGRVRTQFPNEEIKGFSIGWYAFTRATQIRKLRMPAPRVKPGGKPA